MTLWLKNLLSIYTVNPSCQESVSSIRDDRRIEVVQEETHVIQGTKQHTHVRSSNIPGGAAGGRNDTDSCSPCVVLPRLHRARQEVQMWHIVRCRKCSLSHSWLYLRQYATQHSHIGSQHSHIGSQHSHAHAKHGNVAGHFQTPALKKTMKMYATFKSVEMLTFSSCAQHKHI